MKTNDLKKGTRVKLANGWEAEIWNNKKGNTRDCKVFGIYTEIGSVYSHDFIAYQDVNGNWNYDIEYTDAQKKCKKAVCAMGW